MLRLTLRSLRTARALGQAAFAAGLARRPRRRRDPDGGKATGQQRPDGFACKLGGLAARAVCQGGRCSAERTGAVSRLQSSAKAAGVQWWRTAMAAIAVPEGGHAAAHGQLAAVIARDLLRVGNTFGLNATDDAGAEATSASSIAACRSLLICVHTDDTAVSHHHRRATWSRPRGKRAGACRWCKREGRSLHVVATRSGTDQKYVLVESRGHRSRICVSEATRRADGRNSFFRREDGGACRKIVREKKNANANRKNS